ncbi:MAG: hypothetical protein D6708_09825, partial [Candidatus Dadabacteria bacterium]
MAGLLLAGSLSLASAAEVDVVIRLEGRPALHRLAAGATRSARRAALVRGLRGALAGASAGIRDRLARIGATNVRDLWIANAVAARIPEEELEALAALPGVAAVEPDRVAARLLPGPAADSSPPAAWNLDAIRARELWDRGIKGAGVTVAVLDSGADAGHPDLAPRWRGNPGGWFDPYGEHPDAPVDVESPGPSSVVPAGHGTAVLGIAVGGNASGQPIGVAPGARWIAARVFNDRGEATTSAIHQALQWVLDPDGVPATDDAPDVVNLSWGLNGFPGQCVPEYLPDIEALDVADIVVVAAAGNDGLLPDDRLDLSPANYPSVIAVGMSGPHGDVMPESTPGPGSCRGKFVYPDVVAPGFDLWTADLTLGGMTSRDPYRVVPAGTSFSAPHAAGVAALLRSAFPDATAAQVREALRAGARDLGDPGPDDVSGYGLVDAVAAYEALLAFECTDADGDGYSAQGGICGPVDCDDGDPA